MRLQGTVVLLGLLVGVAAHGVPRVAALVPSLKPGSAPELRDRFHDAAARGITQGGVDSIPAGEVRMRLDVSEEQRSCAGPGPCAARASITLRTDRLVATEVTIAGKAFAIKVRLLDSAGREVAKLDDTCDICSIREADEAITRAVGKLVGTNRASMEDAKPAPVEVKPAPVVVEPPKPAPVEPARPPETKPEPPPPTATTEAPKPDKKHIPYRWLAIGSLGVGVIGLAVGIPLVVIDGRPTCNLPNPTKSCPDVYNTVGGGGVMLALGVAGLGASAALFYLDYRSRHKPPTATVWAPMVAPTSGGAAATVIGKF